MWSRPSSITKGIFDYGNKYLKTLTLKQIAEELGIHESTVSRSINGKYMESPRGVFELKYFFLQALWERRAKEFIQQCQVSY